MDVPGLTERADVLRDKRERYIQVALRVATNGDVESLVRVHRILIEIDRQLDQLCTLSTR